MATQQNVAFGIPGTIKSDENSLLVSAEVALLPSPGWGEHRAVGRSGRASGRRWRPADVPLALTGAQTHTLPVLALRPGGHLCARGRTACACGSQRPTARPPGEAALLGSRCVRTWISSLRSRARSSHGPWVTCFLCFGTITRLLELNT